MKRLIPLGVGTLAAVLIGSFSVPLLLGMGFGYSVGLFFTVIAGCLLLGGAVGAFVTSPA